METTFIEVKPATPEQVAQFGKPAMVIDGVIVKGMTLDEMIQRGREKKDRMAEEAQERERKLEEKRKEQQIKLETEIAWQDNEMRREIPEVLWRYLAPMEKLAEEKIDTIVKRDVNLPEGYIELMLVRSQGGWRMASRSHLAPMYQTYVVYRANDNESPAVVMPPDLFETGRSKRDFAYTGADLELALVAAQEEYQKYKQYIQEHNTRQGSPAPEYVDDEQTGPSIEDYLTDMADKFPTIKTDIEQVPLLIHPQFLKTIQRIVSEEVTRQITEM